MKDSKDRNTIKKIPYKLYKIDNTGAVGVLVREGLMKKVVKLQNKYIQELKELMHENEDDVYPYSWAMGWSKERGGKAFYANYLDEDRTARTAIDSFNISRPQKAECYDTKDHELVNSIVKDEYESQFKDALK